MSSSSPAGDQRSPAQIERDIEAARTRLAETVDELVAKVKPSNVAARGKRLAMSTVLDEDGALRLVRIGVVGGVLASVVGLAVWRRTR